MPSTPDARPDDPPAGQDDTRPLWMRLSDPKPWSLRAQLFLSLVSFWCVLAVFDGRRDALGTWGALLDSVIAAAVGMGIAEWGTWLLRRSSDYSPPPANP